MSFCLALAGINSDSISCPKVIGSEVVQVVVADGVVVLGWVDKEQAGLPEAARTLHLERITNSLLKARTFWSCLRERLNSLKRDEAEQVVVVFGVIDLRRVDKEQAGPPEIEEMELSEER